MEILQPAVEQPKQEPVAEHSTVEATPNLNHIQMLSQLGLKDQVFNDEVMEKISYLAERITPEELENLSIKVGNDGWTSKLDKIMTIIQLRDVDKKLKEKRDLIREQIQQYE
jgi:hypothetical protein